MKKQWTAQEAYNKRSERRPLAPLVPVSDDDTLAARRSVELDRRKSLLHHQSNVTHGRRRVIRGGHTRTLSLLSPAKSDVGFSFHQDRDHEVVTWSPSERRTSQLQNLSHVKRASWQLRSQQNPAGVPGIVEDFKLGLKAFVEDIRQITVGDEPITGQPVRSAATDSRDNRDKVAPSDQDTIRPRHAVRPNVNTVFDRPSSAMSTPTPSSTVSDVSRDKSRAGKNKRFSWTPLGFDSMDDDDWSNWESPAPIKPSRWSGSTIGSAEIEDIKSIPEDGDERATPL